MKKLLSIILLTAMLTSTANANERWDLIDGNSSEKILVDTQTLSSNNAWVGTIYKNPQTNKQGKAYSRTIAQWGYSCASRTLTLKSTTFYKNSGVVVSSVTIPAYLQESMAVVPDSKGEAILDYLCSYSY